MTTRFHIGSVLLALALSACGAPPPPEGFHIRSRLISIDPSVITQIRIAIIPQGGDEFMMVEPMNYEDGAVSFDVAADGAGDITISGAYVAALVTPEAGGAASVFDLEVFSDDSETRSPPLVSVFVDREGTSIAEGMLYMPQWPLPLGGSMLIQVNCRTGMADRCFP